MKVPSGIRILSRRKIYQVSLVTKLKCGFCSNVADTISKEETDLPEKVCFNNPFREPHCSTLPFTAGPPIQVKLPAKTYTSVGRLYAREFPSVTTILDATRTKSNLFALLNWRRKQISDLGEKEFNEKVANTKHNGTTFHQAIKTYLSTGRQPELQESNQGHWTSVVHVLPKITQVLALESVVVHPHLKYAGTMDGLVMYENKLCLIDWKTSSKKRTMLKECFSYPHQIVAYAGAVNYDVNYDPLQVCNGLLVLAYGDGSPADTIWMSSDTCQQYWNEWLERLKEYNTFKESGKDGTTVDQRGQQLAELAQYVGGTSRSKEPPQVETSNGTKVTSNASGLDYGVFCSGTSEFYDSPIDVFGIDPSLAEFTEDSNHGS